MEARAIGATTPPGLQGAKAHSLAENQTCWIGPGDRASLTAEEAMIVEKSLAGVEIPEDDRDFVRGQGVRLGLSAEKENRVYSSGFDSLILALIQVMLKVLLRAGLIATWTSLQFKSGLGGEAAQRLGLCGPEPHPTCGIFHRRCFSARKSGS